MLPKDANVKESEVLIAKEGLATPSPAMQIPPRTEGSKFNFSFKVTLFVIVVGLSITGFMYFYDFRIYEENTIASKLYPGKITIGYVPWPGYIGLIIARDKGFFKNQHVDVLLQSYPSLKELSQDYVSGKIQGKANLTLEAIQESRNGFEHQIVLVIDYSNGSDGIIASPQITKFSQIRGKKVGYEFETLEDFFLTYALTENNLQKNDVVSINLSPEESARKLSEGKVDVAVTYEPYMSSVLKQIKGHKIYSSADAPGLITDILTFKRSFIDEYPDTIDAILKGYFQAIDFYTSNPHEGSELVAKEYSTTAEDIDEQLKGIKLLSLRENRDAFTFAAGLQSLYGNLRIISNFVEDNYTSDSIKLDSDALINPFFIRSLTN